LVPKVIVVLYDGAGHSPTPGPKYLLDGWKCTPDYLFRCPDDPLDGFLVLCGGIAVPHSDTTRQNAFFLWYHCVLMPRRLWRAFLSMTPMLWVHGRLSEIRSPRKRKQLTISTGVSSKLMEIVSCFCFKELMSGVGGFDHNLTLSPGEMANCSQSPSQQSQ